MNGRGDAAHQPASPCHGQQLALFCDLCISLNKSLQTKLSPKLFRLVTKMFILKTLFCNFVLLVKKCFIYSFS